MNFKEFWVDPGSYFSHVDTTCWIKRIGFTLVLWVGIGLMVYSLARRQSTFDFMGTELTVVEQVPGRSMLLVDEYGNNFTVRNAGITLEGNYLGHAFSIYLPQSAVARDQMGFLVARNVVEEAPLPPTEEEIAGRFVLAQVFRIFFDHPVPTFSIVLGILAGFLFTGAGVMNILMPARGAQNYREPVWWWRHRWYRRFFSPTEDMMRDERGNATAFGIEYTKLMGMISIGVGFGLAFWFLTW